ncbi:putative reverse transcriptase zinc-binding domain-containing protein [Medicago truncatula]|uniref:Putative reverse transcriptase zinc-binding domain-containing protein n=1 Tax=Medicago truncatula TaxID=3880 RepID=A0A396HUQ8_MEDTR|nr:putative reverse transcriptase zinc-binding domain-containing protein [Medicago truncatula]
MSELGNQHNNGSILVQVVTFGFFNNREVEILFEEKRGWDPNCDMRWIWRLKVPAKIQHFIWLCSYNALPTNVCRHYCNMATSPGCTRCSSLMEDHLHCLRDCPHSKEF